MLLVAAVAVVAVGVAADPSPLTVGVKVNGKTTYLPATVNLGQALDLLRMRPKTGALVDVDGDTLDPNRYPGRVTVNGVVAGPSTALDPGARIQVINGKDHREPLRKRTVKVPRGEPTNPQFVVGSAPGVARVKEGAISHKVLSTVFEPTAEVRVGREVALTFDDGPWPTSTKQVLAILRRFGVKATFFVVGYLAERYPNLVRETARSGMAIANHSWDHPEIPPFKSLPTNVIRRQIGRTSAVLSRLGVRSTLFRPPGGSYSARLIGIARDLGHRVVLWSVDPHDWASGRTASQIQSSVLGSVGPGSIVLLHDGGGNQSATVRALPGIIRGIRAKGLKLVSLR